MSYLFVIARWCYYCPPLSGSIVYSYLFLVNTVFRILFSTKLVILPNKHHEHMCHKLILTSIRRMCTSLYPRKKASIIATSSLQSKLDRCNYWYATILLTLKLSSRHIYVGSNVFRTLFLVLLSKLLNSVISLLRKSLTGLELVN